MKVHSIILPLFLLAALPSSAAVTVQATHDATPREVFGIERLKEALAALPGVQSGDLTILVGTRSSPLFRPFPDLSGLAPPLQEAFHLLRAGSRLFVIGSDPSGVLYGCLELAKRIQAAHAIPEKLNVSDHPVFVLRGPCTGMQKSEITYDGAMYDYCYTPKEFPFFYDKKLWIQYLNFLVDNRLNTLYLWNRHPFTSLLKLPKYPEAQELSDQQLQQNIEIFRWLTTEADKRGIWVIQAFYNIHLSHAFAKAHGSAIS